MYERFTDRARKVMQLANQEAQRFNHEYIGTEHVLLGLIKEGSGVAANVLKNLDVDLRKIRLEVEKLVQSGPDMVTMGKLPQTPRAKKVIEYAMEEARNLNHNYVGTEHILLGLLARARRRRRPGADEPGPEAGRSPRGSAQPARPRHGRRRRHANAAAAAAAARRRRRPQEQQVQDAGPRQLRPRPDRAGPPEASSTRSSAARMKSSGSSRSSAAAPRTTRCCWAKRASARRPSSKALPRRVVDGNVPELLARPPDRRARPGDDGRRHEVPRPVRRAHQGGHERSPPGEEHDPVHRRAAHAGRRRRRGRGDRRLERAQAGPGPRRDPVHRRHDARRVPQVHREGRRPRAPVPGGASSSRRAKTETVEILRGLRDRYEAHHRVQITDDALEAAVELSDRYITGRCLPDKAIDVIDEAGARVRLKAMTRPPDLKEIDDEIERLNKEKEEAVANQDFEKAAALRDQADKLKKKKENDHPRVAREVASEVDGVVDEEVIAEVVSQDDRHPAHAADDRRHACGCCRWKTSCTSGSSARTRRSSRSPRPSAAAAAG